MKERGGFHLPVFLFFLGIYSVGIIGILCLPHSGDSDILGKMEAHQLYAYIGKLTSFGLIDRTLTDWYMLGATLEENIEPYNKIVVSSLAILSPLFVIWFLAIAWVFPMLQAKFTGVTMKKEVLEIYTIIVCFLGLIVLATCVGIGIYAFVRFGTPELTLGAYQFEVHQTNQKFTRNYLSYRDIPLPSETEITQLRKESYKVALESEKRSALQSFILAAIVIVIDSTILVIHWMVFRRKIMNRP